MRSDSELSEQEVVEEEYFERAQMKPTHEPAHPASLPATLDSRMQRLEGRRQRFQPSSLEARVDEVRSARRGELEVNHQAQKEERRARSFLTDVAADRAKALLKLKDIQEQSERKAKEYEAEILEYQRQINELDKRLNA